MTPTPSLLQNLEDGLNHQLRFLQGEMMGRIRNQDQPSRGRHVGDFCAYSLAMGTNRDRDSCLSLVKGSDATLEVRQMIRMRVVHEDHPHHVHHAIEARFHSPRRNAPREMSSGRLPRCPDDAYP